MATEAVFGFEEILETRKVLIFVLKSCIFLNAKTFVFTICVYEKETHSTKQLIIDFIRGTCFFLIILFLYFF